MRKMTKISIITTLALIMLLSVVLFSACNPIYSYRGKYLPAYQYIGVSYINGDTTIQKEIAINKIVDDGYIIINDNGVEQFVEYDFPQGVSEAFERIVQYVDCPVEWSKDEFIIHANDGDVSFDVSFVEAIGMYHKLYENERDSIQIYVCKTEVGEPKTIYLTINYWIVTQEDSFMCTATRVYEKQ